MPVVFSEHRKRPSKGKKPWQPWLLSALRNTFLQSFGLLKKKNINEARAHRHKTSAQLKIRISSKARCQHEMRWRWGRITLVWQESVRFSAQLKWYKPHRFDQRQTHTVLWVKTGVFQVNRQTDRQTSGGRTGVNHKQRRSGVRFPVTFHSLDFFY